MSKCKKNEWTAKDQQEFDRLNAKIWSDSELSVDEDSSYNTLFIRHTEYLYRTDSEFREQIEIVQTGINAVNYLERKNVILSEETKKAMLLPYIHEALTRSLSPEKTSPLQRKHCPRRTHVRS